MKLLRANTRETTQNNVISKVMSILLLGIFALKNEIAMICEICQSRYFNSYLNMIFLLVFKYMTDNTSRAKLV